VGARTAGRSASVGAAVSAVLMLGLGASAVAQTPAPTACQARLAADRVVFKPLGNMSTSGGCGGPDIVLLQRVATPDGSEIAIEPPATLRCEMADAISQLVREDLAPLADAMGSPLVAIENYDSYDCRGRNRVGGAQLSEHGRANALDIRSLRLKDGRAVRPAYAAASVDFRRAMRTAVCTRFATVLGPGSDGYHEDHIHMDLAQRNGGYRMCQWNLHDGAPREAVAHAAAAMAPGFLVPLPRARPVDIADPVEVTPSILEGLRR
jgi:hypothetical protein